MSCLRCNGAKADMGAFMATGRFAESYVSFLEEAAKRRMGDGQAL